MTKGIEQDFYFGLVQNIICWKEIGTGKLLNVVTYVPMFLSNEDDS